MQLFDLETMIYGFTGAKCKEGGMHYHTIPREKASLTIHMENIELLHFFPMTPSLLIQPETTCGILSSASIFHPRDRIFAL